MRASLAGVLARANPDHIRILWIHDDAAESERALLVEDRREGDTAIGRFPQPAESRGDVPDARILRVDLNVLNTPGGEGGAEASQLDALQGLRVEPAAVLSGQRNGRGNGRRRHDRQHSVHALNSGRVWRRTLYSCRIFRLKAEATIRISSKWNRAPGRGRAWAGCQDRRPQPRRGPIRPWPQPGCGDAPSPALRSCTS